MRFHNILILVLLLFPGLYVQSAEISGTLDKPIKELTFIRRVEPKKAIADSYLPEAYPATLSTDGKSFSHKNLPEGSYDIRVRLDNGSIIEGISLGKTNIPQDASGLTDEDIKSLREIIDNLRTFFDQQKIFFIDGWRGMDDLGRQGYAWILVEQLRWRDTSLDKKQDKPFVIWRMDIWQFEKVAGAWRKVKPFKVIYRMNVTEEDFVKYKWYFTTKLTGYEVKAEKKDLGEIKVPEPTPATPRVVYREKGIDLPPEKRKNTHSRRKA